MIERHAWVRNSIEHWANVVQYTTMRFPPIRFSIFISWHNNWNSRRQKKTKMNKNCTKTFDGTLNQICAFLATANEKRDSYFNCSTKFKTRKNTFKSIVNPKKLVQKIEKNAMALCDSCNCFSRIFSRFKTLSVGINASHHLMGCQYLVPFP